MHTNLVTVLLLSTCPNPGCPPEMTSWVTAGGTCRMYAGNRNFERKDGRKEGKKDEREGGKGGREREKDEKREEEK